MTIQLVRVGNVLVGRTASDRWNLASLGITHLAWSANGTALKKLRRTWASDFTFTTVRQPIVARPTDVEADALGNVASSYALAA